MDESVFFWETLGNLVNAAIPFELTHILSDKPDAKFVVIGADGGKHCQSFQWQLIQQPNLVDFDVVILIGRTFSKNITSVTLDSLHAISKTIARMLGSGGQLILVTGRIEKVELQHSGRNTNKFPVSIDYLLPYEWKLQRETGTSIEHARPSQFSRYLSKLEKWNFWIDPQADLETIPFLRNREGRTLAGHFSKGPYGITILPDIPAIGTPDDLAREVLRSYGLITDEVPAPEWASGLTLPGLSEIATEISSVEEEKEAACNKLSDLKNRRANLERFRKLTYSQGDDLEDIVSKVLTSLGAVLLDEKYSDEDLLFKIGDTTCVVEITGTESPLKLQKIRQLFNHVFDVEEASGARPKGIMIANPLRLVEPSIRCESEAPEVPPNVNTRAVEMRLSIVLGRWLFGRYQEFLDGKRSGDSILQEILNADGLVPDNDSSTSEST